MITALSQVGDKFSAEQRELFLLSWHAMNGRSTGVQQHNSRGMFDEELYRVQNNDAVIFREASIALRLPYPLKVTR